jgi:2-polyprenyl-3-methyl-5-hydroxy-6-metoxy-1,4-benzoquinol methylase
VGGKDNTECAVAQVAGHTPGRVRDVGCGEGADAVWLAKGGYDVLLDLATEPEDVCG